MKNQFLLAQRVHDVINNKIINIEIKSHALYYGNTKIQETIEDVNSYLNFLSVEEIHSRIVGEDDLETCADVINLLVKSFNTNFLEVTCFIPKKYNFKINETEKLKESNQMFIEVVMVIIVIIVVVSNFISK